MIRIVEAPPRSGKTYYVVHYLTRFCEYLAIYMEWVLKSPNTLIISNIEGLRIKHIDLDKAMEEAGGIAAFFNYEYFKDLKEKYHAKHIILCIDEAQKLFDRKYTNKTVAFFFQYHGHLGIDVFLMTQSVSTIATWLPPLSEYIVRVQTRSRSVMGTFQYRFHDNKDGLFLGSESLRKRPQVFAAYKSFSSDEIAKPKSALTRYAVMMLILFVGCFLAFKAVIASVSNKGKKSVKNAPVSAKPPQGVPAPSLPPVVHSSYTSVRSVTSINSWVAVAIDGYIKRGEKVVLLIGERMISTPNKYVRSYDLQNKVAIVDTVLVSPVSDGAVKPPAAPAAAPVEPAITATKPAPVETAMLNSKSPVLSKY